MTDRPALPRNALPVDDGLPPGAVRQRLLDVLRSWLAPPVSSAPPAAAAPADSLALLRPLFAALIEQPESPAPFATLLERVAALIEAEAGVLFAIGEDGQSLHPLADTDGAERERASLFLGQSAASLRSPEAPAVEVLHDGGVAPGPLVVVRLRDTAAALHGWLLLRLPAGATLSPVARDQLQTLADALAGIVDSVRRARLSRRLALYEERATIARELHDSLAQSLGYLKIQVSRMQALLARHGDPASPGYAELDAVTQELRGSLNLAYRQLRELITTCRLTMNGRTLTQALEDSASEYAGRSALVVELDNRLGDTALGAHAELQVLQIVREALANVVRHAHARRVLVSLRPQPGDGVRLAVEDDGIGIGADEGSGGERHHGLLIMQERAHGLGGELRVEPRDEGGTRVLVRFVPSVARPRA